MKSEDIFIGDIRLCTKLDSNNNYEYLTSISGKKEFKELNETTYIDSELYKKDAILLRIKKGNLDAYIDIYNIKSLMDNIKARQHIKSDGIIIDDFVMNTNAYALDCLFIDKDTLRPFYEKKKKTNVSVKQLKKQIIRNNNF